MLKKNRNNKGGELNRSRILNSEFAAYVDYVIAQAKHESANFTSNVYKQNNNAFGMKVPSVRPFAGYQGTKAPDGGYYAAYDNDTRSFDDLLKWMRFTHFPTNLQSVEEYAQALKQRSYFTASLDSYTKALKSWLAKR